MTPPKESVLPFAAHWEGGSVSGRTWSCDGVSIMHFDRPVHYEVALGVANEAIAAKYSMHTNAIGRRGKCFVFFEGDRRILALPMIGDQGLTSVVTVWEDAAEESVPHPFSRATLTTH